MIKDINYLGGFYAYQIVCDLAFGRRWLSSWTLECYSWFAQEKTVGWQKKLFNTGLFPEKSTLPCWWSEWPRCSPQRRPPPPRPGPHHRQPGWGWWIWHGGQIQQDWEPEGCPLLATAKSETTSLAGRQLGGCTSEQFWGFRLKLLGWGFQLLSNSSANV